MTFAFLDIIKQYVRNCRFESQALSFTRNDHTRSLFHGYIIKMVYYHIRRFSTARRYETEELKTTSEFLLGKEGYIQSTECLKGVVGTRITLRP